MSEWSKATRWLFWCLAAVIALAIGFGVYDDLHKTQIIDVQRKQNYSLSDALTQAQKQLIDNGVKPNTKTPDEIKKDDVPAAGIPGAAGAVGERGPQGLPGVRGQTGPQGEPGRDGKDGADGSPGKDSTVAGPTGGSGKDGADSTVPGPQGPVGAAGPAGPAGPAGATGPAGKDGVNGAPGADGRSVTSVGCTADGLSTFIVFYDQSGAEIGRVQSMCTPTP
ncbi:hypothetical protein [Curtobacterium sp. SORGH_AS_0776]|uniref:hypothetical protein n=1 Tax=Curtobacterium sp. SORGH_AS_0776 TaxID=3041798 RepID=UPI0028588875|nr:hypothetical protein [Curtobacterium sp. SORGH_AS_0776]MDR6172665.1 hypothetical protein [Curtobacterium sp. SORGH_AS_0776]